MQKEEHVWSDRASLWSKRELLSKTDALAVRYCSLDTGVSMTERQQRSCTSDRGQQSV